MRIVNMPLPAAVCVALYASAAAPALAQTGSSEEIIDEVVTTATPIRDSQAAAIEAKRNADNVVDIIASDLIGRFPDQNLADSLGRVPGLAIERDQGQARYINFRGAPFRYTAILIDGIEVPGAENGRIPRFDSYPSVITSMVEANKAITADLPGSAVAGAVNIRTFDPFLAEGFAGSLEAGYGEQNLGGGDVEKLNGRFSFSNDNFGAVVFASRNMREQTTDNREYELEIDASTDELLVNSLDFRSYKVDREDSAFGGRLEYRGEGTLSALFVSSLFNEFKDSEQRNQYIFDIADGAEAAGGSVDPGNSGYQPLVLVSRLLEDGIYENSTLTSTVGADLLVGSWLVDLRVNMTETEFRADLPIPYSVGGAIAGSYDLTDVYDPQFTVFEPFSQTPMDLSDVVYAADLGLGFGQDLEIEATTFKIDGDTELSLFGRDSVIRTGVTYETREADGYGNSLQFGGFPATIDIANFDTGEPWASDFDNSIGATYFDNSGLYRAWDAEVGGVGPFRLEDQQVVIEEDVLAAYVMTSTEFEGWQMTLGMRAEQTDFKTVGPAIDISYSNDYSDILPNAHFNFDLSDTLKLRVSASTGVSRPTYVEARASAIVDVANDTVTGGNPALEAETSVGGDVSLEWYFAEASLLSGGIFYRSIDDVIYSSSTTVDGGLYDPGSAGEDWDLVGFVNGEDGHFSGVEVQFTGQLTDGPLGGFGLTSNVTLLDSEFTTADGLEFQLPGTSDLIINASVFYENFGLSARVNYQYRDTWLTAIEDLSFGEFWDEQQRLDFSIRYELPLLGDTTKVTLFGNANNLTDETDVRYVGQLRTPDQVEAYGRRFVVGARVDF